MTVNWGAGSLGHSTSSRGSAPHLQGRMVDSSSNYGMPQPYVLKTKRFDPEQVAPQGLSLPLSRAGNVSVLHPQLARTGSAG